MSERALGALLPPPDAVRGRVRRGAGRPWPRPSLAAAGLGLVVLAAAVTHPALFTHTDPNGADYAAILRPPGAHHWLGTDENGRDVYARVVHGARPSLLIGLSASALALAAGTLAGVLAGQGGRFVDQAVSRLLDTLLSIPGMLLVFLIVAVLGRGTRGEVIGLALVTFPGYARLTRGEVIRLRGAPFVEAARTLGWSRPQVVLRHVVPNAVGPILALTTIGVGGMIVAGSSLSFLGLGPQPPTAEWGAMLAASRDYFSAAWWTAVFPGAAITLTVVSITVVGQALQRRLEGRAAS